MDIILEQYFLVEDSMNTWCVCVKGGGVGALLLDTIIPLNAIIDLYFSVWSKCPYGNGQWTLLGRMAILYKPVI